MTTDENLSSVCSLKRGDRPGGGRGSSASSLVEEIVLGFDVRADPRVPWEDRGLRTGAFLLREVAQPLAADSSVWPHRATDTLKGATGFSVEGWRYWTEDEARDHVGANQVAISVTVRLIGLQEDARRYWEDAAWVGGPPKQEWRLLGYDVGSRSCLSGLSNCGYGAERDAWAAAWGSVLNEHHLVIDGVSADALARATNARTPEHGPFSAFGLYLVATEARPGL
jgi:hypothetical protein